MTGEAVDRVPALTYKHRQPDVAENFSHQPFPDVNATKPE